jgi:transcriptional repressor NrdR
MVLQQLREMSDVAYVRFASVYRQFKSVSDFVSALEVLGEPTPNRGKTRASLAAVP